MADIARGGSQIHGITPEDNPVPTDLNPIVTGARANENEPTEVSADDDVVISWADLVGRQVVAPHFPSNLASATHGPKTNTVTASGDTTIIAAPAAGLSIYVVSIAVSNGDAAKKIVEFREGAAGTSRLSMHVAADGGGFIHTFPVPWKLPAATLLAFNANATSSDLRVTTTFFVAA